MGDHPFRLPNGGQVVSPVPLDQQSDVSHEAIEGILRQPEAARALLDFLVSPEGAALFRASGFQ